MRRIADDESRRAQQFTTLGYILCTCVYVCMRIPDARPLFRVYVALAIIGTRCTISPTLPLANAKIHLFVSFYVNFQINRANNTLNFLYIYIYIMKYILFRHTLYVSLETALLQ